jgi:hypothetical protein
VDEKRASLVAAGCSITRVAYGRRAYPERGKVGAVRILRGLVSRHLHNAEIFLRDEMPFQAKAKFVTSRRGEDWGGDKEAFLKKEPWRPPAGALLTVGNGST